MHLGRREKVPFPESYRGFVLHRAGGRLFGIPPALDAALLIKKGTFAEHPAVLETATLEEMREQVDHFDEASNRPEVIGRAEGHDVVRLRGALYAVPPSAAGDLNVAAERRRVGAISGRNQAELETAVRRARAAAPVEFAGWLPIYTFAGNCGQHPQFLHADEPPPGYRFTYSAPAPERQTVSRLTKTARRLGLAVASAAVAIAGAVRVPLAFFRPQRGVSLRDRWVVLVALVKLFVLLMARGCKLRAVMRFLQTRHLQSQLLLGDHPGPVFLTSMPFTFGQTPWVIEIEDPTTLFYPMIQNGQTSYLSVENSPYLPIIKTLLEADNCKAILTHMRSTADLVPTLFGSEIIREKVVYSPLGVKVPARWQRHEDRPDDEPIDLLFINSWCQVPTNFYLRGGLEVLDAFAILKERYPQVRLTMRTGLPGLSDHYNRILESGWVRVSQRFLPAEEMAQLHAESHIFLLPAARVHIVSLLQAMSYGLAVIGSDGWGMEEYLDHERNGLVVKGRHGKVSWEDEQAGLLREDYEPMHLADPEVIDGIVEAVSRLVEDRELRRRLGREARRDVEEKYNLDGWNRGLKAAIDRAMPGQRPPVSPTRKRGSMRAGSLTHRSVAS